MKSWSHGPTRVAAWAGVREKHLLRAQAAYWLDCVTRRICGSTSWSEPLAAATADSRSGLSR